MKRRFGVLLACLVLLSVVAAFVFTLEEGDRIALSDRQKATGPSGVPTLECLTGYDRDGRCVAKNLAGGVHSFLLPGLLAATVAVVLGLALGLLLGYSKSVARAGGQGLIQAMEALPRLVFLLICFVLWDHDMHRLGLVLGMLSAPELAQQVAARVALLEQSDFIPAARAHGVPELRVVTYHVLWLSARADTIRHLAAVFRNMLVVETSLSYILQTHVSATEWSFGYQLRRATEDLYAFFWRVKGGLEGGVGAITWGHTERAAPTGWLEALWTGGLPQFLSVVLALVGVIWSVTYLAEITARAWEENA